jgi:hypothetical protein
MRINASGRAALIAAGLLAGLAGPSQAATDDDTGSAPAAEAPAGPPVKLSQFITHPSHHSKKHAHHKLAGKSADDKGTFDATASDTDNSPPAAPVTIPSSVANANAQIAAPDPLADNARAMTDRANTIVQSAPDAPAEAQPTADAEIVPPDQLNEVDRSLRDSTPPASPVTLAAAEPPAAAVTAAATSEPSAWTQTSLIGKIFIGFGALLTMASAARMFIA